jgi:two-component system, cell cycle sensor histidine kinase and response regulator CckA
MRTTVLIVDDEDLIRRLFDRVLQSAGYVTRLASNGSDALAVAEASDPIDLLVTDMMMPEMNGDEVARRLRQKHPALKVLYCTGYSDQLFDQKGTMWEDEAFIDKPCSPRALLEAVSLLRNSNRCIGEMTLEQAQLSIGTAANAE